MRFLLRYRHWRLRTKVAALLAVATLVPAIITAVISISAVRQGRIADMDRMLIARAEQLSHELDSINAGYLGSIQRVRLQPAIAQYCSPDGRHNASLRERVSGIFAAFPKSDHQIRGMALVNEQGVVDVSTNKDLEGTNMARRSTIAAAMSGRTLVSDIYVSESNGQEFPTTAYLVPVMHDQKVACVLALWVHASAVWDVLKAANEKAGADSFAVLFDSNGIRIGHSFRQELVFRPAGVLPPSLVRAFIDTRRFGSQTSALLQEIRPFSYQFDIARSPSGSSAVFRGYAPANSTWNYGVASRLRTVDWTVFYMMPELSLKREIADATHGYVFAFALVTLLAVLLGAAFANTILNPIRLLAQAARELAGGNKSARVPITSSDELGQLAKDFNNMAEELQSQATHLQNSHDSLQSYAKELEEANHDLDAFTRSVSHDLRSPLSVISGFSSLLSSRFAKARDEQAVDHLSKIRRSAKQMGDLIDGLLKLSRLGRQSLTKETVDLRAVVEDSVEQLRNEDVLTNHRVDLDLPITEVFGDRILLRQALVNLISNAAKFTSAVDSPAIKISTSAIAEAVLISVSDNGPGFSPDDAQRLFQPFERLSATSDIPGIGLGLSIVHRIVAKHGGRVSASAEPGKGASFTIELPAAS